MKSSRALSWFLLLLLPLTLGWKLAVRAGGSGENPGKEFQTSVAQFLVRQHFIVAAGDDAQEGRPTIRATARDCRMLIAKSPALGWDRDMLRPYSTPADRVFVVFRGRVYADQPAWLTVSDALWSRFRRELGFSVLPAPVLAVIATTTCDAERLPWRELD